MAETVIFLTCVPKKGPFSDAPCRTMGDLRMMPEFREGLLIPTSQASAIDAIAKVNTGTIDYASAGAAWAASFSLTVLCWVTAKKIGLVLSLLKTKG
jgi:hypothetical protein